MCEIYGFCGNKKTNISRYTNEFWLHSRIHKDGFGFYLADSNKLYVNPDSAISHIDELNKMNFNSKLALCHIRFKTHGDAKIENCHPFIKRDIRGIKWCLIHNGFIEESPATNVMNKIQVGETDSERILLCLIEAVNFFYEHSWIESYDEFLQYLYIHLESTLQNISRLGRVNLIFTDSSTNNMYVFMNRANTLFYLKTDNGYHISTTPLSNENWKPVEPFKLHIFNDGDDISI